MNIYETVSHEQYPPNQATDQRAGPNSASLASGEQAEHEKPNQPDEKIEAITYCYSPVSLRSLPQNC